MAEPYMTMAEIEAKYPNQWVLIDNPKVNRRQEIVGGHVVLHCADRAEFLRRVGDGEGTLTGKLAAVRYAGRFPEDDEEILPVDSTPGASLAVATSMVAVLEVTPRF
jgi:hypothetical protein